MKVPKFHEYRPWRAFDVESSGSLPEYALQPWSEKGFLRSFAQAWFNEKHKPVSRSTHPRATRSEIHGALTAVLGKGKAVVGWNVAFDAAWCIALGLREEVMQTTWLDGMLLWKHLTRFPESDINRSKRKKYGLKDAVAEFLPQYAGYGDGVEFHGGLTDEEWQELLRYNRLDATFTLMLSEMFWNKLRKEPQRLKNALLEMRAISEVADHYVTGLFVDVPYAQHLRKDVTAEHTALLATLSELGLDETVMSSPKQLSEVLYNEWGLPVLVRTPKGAPSTDKNALDQLSRIDDRVADMAHFRELGNLRTKFVDKILESCEYNEAPVTHPTANLGGTYTGRATFSSFIGKNKDKRQTGFAIHQMSSKSQYRRQIVPPRKFTLVEFDAAGQEYRWMAVASGDETMLALCEPGEDPHAYMTAEIMPQWEYRDIQREAKLSEAAAKDRKCGKVSNLSCQYRIGKPKFQTTARVQYGLVLSEAEAAHYHDTYHATYRGVKDYWRRQIREAKIEGRVVTFAGRVCTIECDWSDRRNVWMYESASINFPIQGTGADQKFLAIAALKTHCRKYNARFYFELHDGIYYIVPTRYAEKFAEQGQRILNDLPYFKMWGFEPPIPLPWDVKMSDQSWGDMKEVEF